MTAAPDLLVEQKDGVLAVAFNRPDVLNSMTLAMLKGYSEALKKAEKDPSIRVVTLTGSGRAFCAGADLGDLQKRQAAKPFSLGDELRDHFNPVLLQMRKLEKPIVGIINGLAAGAGASLILGTDLKVCSEDAKFINAFVKVGLVPDTGMTYFMPRYLGLSLALEHAWLAKPVTAQQALHYGWVNRVVPSSQLQDEADALVRELLRMPPLALAFTKRALHRSLDNDLESQMEYEAQLQEILGKTKDHQEGVSAFLQKRAPQFRGE